MMNRRKRTIRIDNMDTLVPVDDPVEPYEEADRDDGHKDQVKPQNVDLQVD